MKHLKGSSSSEPGTGDSSQRWPLSIGLPRIDDGFLRGAELFGPPLELESTELRDEVTGFETDLQSLLQEFSSGAVHAFREGSQDFLAELRRAFLRHHRRLTVEARGSGLENLEAMIRKESAEMAMHFRDVVLTRASRIKHEHWGFLDFAEKIERVAGYVIERLQAPLEPASYSAQPGDRLWVRLVRWSLRWRRKWRRWMKKPAMTRVVWMRELALQNLLSHLPSGLEGFASLVVQSEVQLVVQSRRLFEEMDRALVGLPDRVKTGEEAENLLKVLRESVENEFIAMETEQHRHALDGLERLRTTVGHGIQQLKRQVRVAGTFELPSNRKGLERTVEETGRQRALLTDKLTKARDVLSSSHALSGMRLEFSSFQKKIDIDIQDFLMGLTADIRGRSFTQIERTTQGLDSVIEVLQSEDTADEFNPELRNRLEQLERVVQEAIHAGGLLDEQLMADQVTQPLVETLSRAASELTDRYRVPTAPLERSEFRIPSPPSVQEVPFARVASAFVQTDLAPRLIERTSAAARGLGPLRAVLSDVERLVQYHPDRVGSELELEGTGALGSMGIREALLTAARSHRDTLEELESKSESWSRDLRQDILHTVDERLSAFAKRLHEADVGRLKTIDLPSERIRPVAGRLGRRIRDALRQLLESMARTRPARWFRGLTRSAQLRSKSRTRDELDQLLSPPRFAQIPVYYRRLFAPQSHWAGDVVPSSKASIERARRLLSSGTGEFRSVAVVGVDGAGRGAVVSAVLQGVAHTSIRRLNFTRPADVLEVESGLEGLGRGGLVVVNGLGFLLDALPGGFAPVEAFASLILQDQGRNGWLLEADELIWRYAGQIAPLHDVFLERVDVRPLGREELERAIFARHHLSGMILRFIQGRREDEVASDGSENRRSPLKEAYFADLHQRSEGLLQVALTLWLASLDGFQEDAKQVNVRNVPPSPRAALDQLPEAQLNMLYVTLRQGWMRAETLSFIYREPQVTSEARLGRMVYAGLLEKTSDGVYVVRRHLRGAAHRFLEDRGYA
ncbi:MAG: hypothetical protein ACFB9M_15305 [Myxococcota bacterium]